MEWILVADAAQARLLRREGDADALIPVTTWTHAATHAKPSEVGADRPGHASSDQHPGGTRLEPRIDPRRKEHEQFAHELADRLEHAAQQGEYARLSVYAPPAFLGELRTALGRQARSRLHATVALDLTAYGLSELEKRIAEASKAAGQRAAPHP